MSPHGHLWLRIRITRDLTGSIEGIQLGQFRNGHIYDVVTSLGSYLICERCADLVIDESPVLPLDQQGLGHRHEPLAFTVKGIAADRARKKRK